MTAIIPDEINFYLSIPSGTQGSTLANVAGSALGGWISVTQVSSTPLDNVFLDITGPQNAARQVDYACVFVANDTVSGNPMLNTFLWLPSRLATSPGANMFVASDPTGVTVKTSTLQQAVKITSPTTAPAGAGTWEHPVSVTPSSLNGFAGAVMLGNIPAGYCAPFWIQRAATNSGPISNDSFGILVGCESNA